MAENISEEKDGEQINNEEEISRSVHLLGNRMPFQAEVLRTLIAEKMLDEKNMDEVERYSKIISDFIDDPINTDVRNLIVQKEFKEAAEIMVLEIIREEALPEAA